jgi:hypothetical protein
MLRREPIIEPAVFGKILLHHNGGRSILNGSVSVLLLARTHQEGTWVVRDLLGCSEKTGTVRPCPISKTGESPNRPV